MFRPVFQRKLDSSAEQKLLLAEREILETNISQGRKRRVRNPSEIDSGVSWYTDVGFDEDDEEMPLRMSMNRRRKPVERRNATAHTNHRMSLMKGILSVASGEGESPAPQFKAQNKLPRYLASGEDADGVYALPQAAFKPLPDPDEYYQKKTYVVVNKQGVIFRFTEAKALFLLGKESKIRQSAINLFIQPLFSQFIMLVIIANCICMMFSEPPPVIENYLEYVFTAIYCFEAFVKIIGHGFVLHRFTYLRDYWNWLDFIVIVSALITEILKHAISSNSLGQLSVLRAFRVLRALKTMSVVPGLRGIVKALLRSIHALKDAVLLTVFCLAVFALIGYQLFHGTMTQKCVKEPGSVDSVPDPFYATKFNTNVSSTDYNLYANSSYHVEYYYYYYQWMSKPISSKDNDTSRFNLYPIFSNKDFHINKSYVGPNVDFVPNNLTDTFEGSNMMSWTTDDKLIIGNISKTLNETEQTWQFANESLSNTCEDINLCIIDSSIQVMISSSSSMLLMEERLLRTSLNELFVCHEEEPTSPLHSRKKNEFVHGSEVVTANITYLCNVSVIFQSANIKCLNDVLGNLTTECGDNLWVNLYQHLNMVVSRNESKKSIVSFNIQHLNTNLRSQTYSFYREFTREEFSPEEEKAWDVNEENHVLQSANAALYYYENSTNIPSREPQYCIIGDSMCPDGFICRQAGNNPDNGYTNFDHFGWAFLTSFRLIAQDAWSRLYYLTLHTVGKWYVIFYIIIMFLGSYYLINLILAVVYMAYEEQQAAVEEEELEAQEREAEKREEQLKAQAMAEGKDVPAVEVYESGGHSESDLIQPRTSRYKRFKRRHWKRHFDMDADCTCDVLESTCDIAQNSRHSIYSHCSALSDCSCSSQPHNDESDSSRLSLPNATGRRWHSTYNQIRSPSDMDKEQYLRLLKKKRLSEGNNVITKHGMATLTVPDQHVFVSTDDSEEQSVDKKSILRKSSAPSDAIKKNGTVVEAEVVPSSQFLALPNSTMQPTFILTSPSAQNLANPEVVNNTIPSLLVTSESRESLRKSVDFTPPKRNSRASSLNVVSTTSTSCHDISKPINASSEDVEDTKYLKAPKVLPASSRSDALYDVTNRERSVSFCDTSDIHEHEELLELTLPPPTMKKNRFKGIQDHIIEKWGKWTCCSPFFLRIQWKVRMFVLDPFMDLFITLCISLNTLFMSLEQHPMETWFKDMLETANLIFTAIFALEMLLKIIGLTPYTYFKEKWNVFDCTIVVFSLLELLLKSVQGLSVLRTFRLLRILKLAKAWPTLNKLLMIIGRTVGKLWHLTCVFLLVLFIFAVVGMQLLRKDYEAAYGDNMPRWNFYDFFHSFMVVFRIQCGEWIENMFVCMSVSRPAICIPLFILVYVIGNLVILNLFLALLLNSFSGDALQRTESETNSISLAIARIRKWSLYLRNSIASSGFLSNCCVKIQSQICPKDEETRSINILDLQMKRMPPQSTEQSITDDCITMTTSANGIGIKSISDRDIENNNRMGSVRSKVSNYKDVKKYHKKTCHHHPINRKHLPGCKLYSKLPFASISCSLPNVNNRDNIRKPRYKPGFAPASEFQDKPDNLELNGLEPILRTVSADPKNVATYPSSQIQKENSSNYSLKSGTSSVYSEENEQLTNKQKSSKASLLSMASLPPSSEDSSENMDIRSPLIKERSLQNSIKSNPRHSTKTRQGVGTLQDGPNYTNGRLSVRSIEAKPRTQRISSMSSYQSKQEDTKSEKSEEKKEDKKHSVQLCCPVIWPNENLKPGRWRSIRAFFHKFVCHPFFENTVIFCILLSSVALAFEDVHLHKKPKLKKILDIMDVFFCIFFAIEMIFKWIGLGIRTYFTNYWCWLDFFIVSISVVNLILSAIGFPNLGALRVLRTFRAFRPLRALSRFEGMKVVVDALLRAIPSIGQVFLVCMIFWLIFSILGVNLFAGRFGRCVSVSTQSILPRRIDHGVIGLQSEEEATFPAQCHYNLTDIERFMRIDKLNELSLQNIRFPAVKDRAECTACATLLNTTDIHWNVPSVNFDNILHGYLALLQIATFKGWLEIMNSAIDITGIEQQPEYEVAFYYYVYFLVFIVCGAFFSLNLFIGVIIDNFNEQKKDSSGGEGGGVFLTDEQKKYYNAMKKMSSKTPSKPIPRPSSVFANKIYDIVTNRKFEIVVMGLIILNMFVMALEHHNMDKDMSNILQYINMAFIGIFIVEAVLKLIGLRLYYFTIYWNVFDLIVVIVSLVASALSDLVAQYFLQPTLLRIIRLFRVTRILRLIREAKGIRTLLFALMMSLPALFNIGTLLFLVVFIFAILGMSQFAYVQKIGGVDELLNFETFPNSFLVLFQVSTSEGWNTFIQPVLQDHPPHCDPTIQNPGGHGNGNCGNYTVGTIYFITFVLMTFLIVINMYIAIILENFEVATRESAEPLTADDFEQFFEVWQRYDDRLTQYVSFEQLQDLLHHLDFPLRVPYPNTAFIAQAEMRISLDGKIHCLEVVIALIKKVLGDPPELNQFKQTMLESFKLKSGAKATAVQDDDDTIDTMQFLRRLRAAVTIQRYYRQYLQKEAMKADDYDEKCDEDSVPS